MLKKVIKYKDFNGTEREETFYFNMTETELGELDIDAGGTLAHRLVRIVQTQNGAEMAKFIKELIVRSYGEKSDDGRYFEKGDNYELGRRFTRSNAFDILFRELMSDPTGEAISSFIYSVVPEKVAEQARANTNPNITVGNIDELIENK